MEVDVHQPLGDLEDIVRFAHFYDAVITNFLAEAGDETTVVRLLLHKMLQRDRIWINIDFASGFGPFASSVKSLEAHGFVKTHDIESPDFAIKFAKLTPKAFFRLAEVTRNKLSEFPMTPAEFVEQVRASMDLAQK